MAVKKEPVGAAPVVSDKKKALQTALAQIEKNFGKGTVMRLGDRPDMNVDAIPTGSLALDAALGIGAGYCCGGGYVCLWTGQSPGRGSGHRQNTGSSHQRCGL